MSAVRCFNSKQLCVCSSTTKIKVYIQTKWFKLFSQACVCGHLLLFDTVLYSKTLTTSRVTPGSSTKGGGRGGCTLSNSAFCHRRKIIMKLRSLAPKDVKKCWEGEYIRGTGRKGERREKEEKCDSGFDRWFPSAGMFALWWSVEIKLSQLISYHFTGKKGSCEAKQYQQPTLFMLL